RLTAALEVPEGGAEGVVCALGDWNNGWAVYVVEGRPAVAFSLFGEAHVAGATAPLPPGRHQLAVAYERTGAGGGPVRLEVDGEEVAGLVLPADLPFRWQIGGARLLVGRHAGLPVVDAYRPPFPFTESGRASGTQRVQPS